MHVPVQPLDSSARAATKTFGEHLLMTRLIRYALTGVTFAVLAACGGGSSPPADASDSIAPLAAAGKASVADRLAVPGGAVQSTLDARLARAKGPTDVWVTPR